MSDTQLQDFRMFWRQHTDRHIRPNSSRVFTSHPPPGSSRLGGYPLGDGSVASEACPKIEVQHPNYFNESQRWPLPDA